MTRKIRNEKGPNEPPKVRPPRPPRPEPEVIPPHLSVREAGKRLRRSPTAVRGMLERGELKTVRIGRVLRVLESSIDQIVTQNIQ